MSSGKRAAAKIMDGYIHFKIAEANHVHYLHKSTNSFDLSDLEHDVGMGKEEEGMKKLIHTNYVFYKDNGDTVTEDEIEIVSHHFEFEHHD